MRPQPPRNIPLTEDEEGRIELEQYLWRDRRRRVNDEQALDDMGANSKAVERPSDVPRGMHLHRAPPPAMGIMLLLAASMICAAVMLWLAFGGNR